MSLAHHALPHRRDAGRRSEEVHARTIIEGLVALLALIAFIGAVAGAATWGAVRLLTFVVS